MDNDKKPHKIDTGGILFALFIMLLGGFALLFDVSPFTGLFRLVNYWPLLLVGLGIWLVFKNMHREKIGAIVLAVMLVAAMYSVFSQIQPPLETLEEKDVPSGVSDLDVSMDLVLGTFSVDSVPEVLYTFKGNQAMKSTVRTVGETAKVNLSLHEEAFIPLKWSSNEFEILLNQDLPISLNVNTGASSCYFDFSHLHVKEFILEGGASTVELIFGETSTDAAITMGVSSITIYIPKTAGVRIVSDGLLSLSVPPGWTKIDDEYRSPNYDTAAYIIDISCTVGLGSIAVYYS